MICETKYLIIHKVFIMETINHRYHWLNAASLMLLFPAAYFIAISVLKYGLGITAPFDASYPMLEKMGIRENLGWNINLLILFGPVISLLLSASQILHIEWYFSKDQLQFSMTIRRKWFPLFTVFLDGLILATLFTYLVGENL